MSLFQCECCGAVENTACSAQGTKSMQKLFDWTANPERKGMMLCSVCAPKHYRDGTPTKFGKWHNQFNRNLLPMGMFKTDDKSNLVHIENGDSHTNYITKVSEISENEIVAQQLEFVTWLEANDMYNEFDTAPMMQKAQLVWEKLTTQTPSSRWKSNNQIDPHGTHYDCERAKLCKGNLTDDELANEVYLKPTIANLTAAKERIRWLSRQIEGIITDFAQEPISLAKQCEKAFKEAYEEPNTLQILLDLTLEEAAMLEDCLYHDDRGPIGEGWQSDELAKLSSKINNLINTAREE